MIIWSWTYVPGKDLQEILEESRSSGRNLDEETVLTWSEQIIDALAYLHRRTPPVLHRDIKPSNIKLTPDHRIKLVDFGLVKVMAAEEARTITVVQGKGTIMYTPLEQYGGEGGHTDARTDIYALGATLYTLLTGVPPAHAKARFLNPNSFKPTTHCKSKTFPTCIRCHHVGHGDASRSPSSFCPRISRCVNW